MASSIFNGGRLYIYKFKLSHWYDFHLVYISAIAIVLISVVLVLGSNISGSGFGPLTLFVVFFSIAFNILDTPTMLIAFPKSLSSMSMSSLGSILLVSHFYTVLLLSAYFYAVGIYLTGSFFTSLYHKSSTGIRSITLSNNWHIPLL